MSAALKEEVLALLPRESPGRPLLAEAPVAEEFCTCPECGCPGAEVWSESQAYVAGCPECHLEFVPVLEGMKLKIRSLVERRRRKRNAGHRGVARSQRVKDEILQTLA